MSARPKMLPLHELAFQLAWSTYELATLLGWDQRTIYDHLVDGDGTKVEAVGDLPPDGHVWLNFAGVLIPGRKNHNGHVTFLRFQVEDALRGGNRLVAEQADS